MRTLAVLGPTASGKSAVAMALAEGHPGLEIVSIDAMQVYRGLDIGTAKPSADDRRQVPHHLLDVVEPSEEFTVARFQESFVAVRRDIESRGATPLLVGGTGLYLRAAVDGLDVPGNWPDVRARLEAEVESRGSETLHARLARLDAVAAARMEPSNARRVVRALEVVEGSGRPFSSYGPGLDDYPPSDVVQVALRWPRNVLTNRIENRIRSMVAHGWLDEVASLRSVRLSRTARAALGYEQLLDVVEGRRGLESAIEEIALRTRQFAVRQERWFRRDPRITWIDVVSDPVTESLPVVERLLA